MRSRVSHAVQSFADAVAMALQVPARNPGRTALTTLGLAIGVAAFIAMVSFGRGARSSVVAQFETLGSNVLRVRTRYAVSAEPPRLLAAADVRALERESTTLARVIPHATASMTVTYAGESTSTSVRGSSPAIAATGEYALASGALFDEGDMARRNKVCVLGAATAEELFGKGEALGAVVNVGSLPCRVIGVLSARGESISGSSQDQLLVMPLSTFETHFGLPNGYSHIEVRPKSRELLDAAKLEVAQIMRQSHKLAEGAENDFNIVSPDDVTVVAEQIGGILTALLAGIAAVSLLVGGIGIMNIQLVSVAERTHEIGIRAAVGAAPEQIMRQFLAEAVVLAGIGALAGVGLGVGVGMVVAKQMNWPGAVAPDVVIFAAAFGVLVGTVFGYLPAKRAAQLDPIEALRRE